jgi:hypothetical protein
MKKLIIIIIVSIVFTTNSKSQTGVPDTLSYLQTIVANKTNYVGQPFSKLMNDLQIQIKYFSPFASLPYNRFKETSTSFAFYFPRNADEIYLIYPHIEIYWQTPLNAAQSDILWTNNNGGGWSVAVANFYANAIVSDIQLRD